MTSTPGSHLAVAAGAVGSLVSQEAPVAGSRESSAPRKPLMCGLRRTVEHRHKGMSRGAGIALL